ncbi:hypothetical protein MF271_10255 [Deinococcus sp. KNUC1210]|uniref:hypothetical protein n=1 Tax=Deinococcus sp. KNUC1210 TaxID=2917691 RepID=UPI001EF10A74|nr:hypothetical protein [Deinococcus sp. KNUC1210]ULH14419.1 hypothetical protein MF271_10255 [Deinococcus sp. KNUC1210]
MSALPPDPSEGVQPDALEQQLRGLPSPMPEWSVARSVAQDVAWARLLTPPAPAESVAHLLAARISREAGEQVHQELHAPVSASRPGGAWQIPAAFAGAAGLLLAPMLWPEAGTLASGTWAALGLTSPLGWSGAAWTGLVLAVFVALMLSGPLRRWQASPVPRWTGGLLTACLLPLLLNDRPAASGTQILSLIRRDQSTTAVPWWLLLTLVALLMLIRWPTVRALRFTPALARGILSLGLAVLGTLALLRLNLKGLGLGGLLLTALSLLVGLSLTLKMLGRQLLARLRWPASHLMEAAFGLSGFALLTLEPRVAAPAALMGGLWGLGQLLSPAEAGHSAAA